MDNDVKNIKNTTRLSQSETRHVLNNIREKVDQLPGMSAEQFTVLKDMLRENGAKIAALQRERVRSVETDVHDFHEKISEDNIIEHHDSNHGDETDPMLFESVGRLCSLASQTERMVYSDEAQSLIDDLQHLLGAALKQASKPSIKGEFLKRKQVLADTTCSGTAASDIEYERDLKRIKGLLTASSDVAVNQAGMLRYSYC